MGSSETEKPILPWFASRGQIIQTLIAVLALALAIGRAWPDLSVNDMFTGGAILVYVLVALVLFSIGWGAYQWQVHREFLRGVSQNPVIQKMPGDGKIQAAAPMKPATQNPVMQKAPSGGTGIRIESADYGSDRYRVDVTKRVRAMQADPKYGLPNGGIGLPVTNDALLDGADPHYGVVKYLEVRLSQVAPETKVLILPHVSP